MRNVGADIKPVSTADSRPLDRDKYGISISHVGIMNVGRIVHATPYCAAQHLSTIYNGVIEDNVVNSPAILDGGTVHVVAAGHI